MNNSKTFESYCKVINRPSVELLSENNYGAEFNIYKICENGLLDDTLIHCIAIGRQAEHIKNFVLQHDTIHIQGLMFSHTSIDENQEIQTKQQVYITEIKNEISVSFNSRVLSDPLILADYDDIFWVEFSVIRDGEKNSEAQKYLCTADYDMAYFVVSNQFGCNDLVKITGLLDVHIDSEEQSFFCDVIRLKQISVLKKAEDENEPNNRYN